MTSIASSSGLHEFNELGIYSTSDLLYNILYLIVTYAQHIAQTRYFGPIGRLTMGETPRATRGHGLLEGFLARRRVVRANCLIPEAARNGRVLDIGCGSHPLFLLETEFAEKYGLDRVPSALREDGIQLQHHDVTANAKLPFDDSYFEVVTMLAVFEHLDRPAMAKLAGEIFRVLRPGGCYILTTPAAWTNPILQVLSRLGLISEEEIDEHEPLYGMPEICGILTAAEFSENGIESGHFELGLNTWTRAVK